MRTPGLFQPLVRLWASVIEAAKTSTCSRLIVSAAGCGAFSNPPEEVARAFLTAVSRATPGRYLTHIYMCVMDDHNSRNNVARIRDVLIDHGIEERATPPMPQVHTPSPSPAPVNTPVNPPPVAPAPSGGSRELAEPKPEGAPEYPLSPDAVSVPSSSSSPAALGAYPRGDGATTPELMRYREWWGQDIGDSPSTKGPRDRSCALVHPISLVSRSLFCPRMPVSLR